jgi:hypothetical protein
MSIKFRKGLDSHSALEKEERDHAYHQLDLTTVIASRDIALRD